MNQNPSRGWFYASFFLAVLAMWSVVKPLSHSIDSWLVDQDSQLDYDIIPNMIASIIPYHQPLLDGISSQKENQPF